MKNNIWYISLSIASIIMFVYTIWKKKDRKLIAFYFFIAGFTYFLEYFVLVLLNGYNYYPKVLKNEYFDNIMGAVVSDAFTIPMTTTFVAAFKLKFWIRFFIAALITVIEVMFVKINIYEHYWWRYVYTFAGAIIVYFYGQRWLSLLQRSINRITRFITLFFANLAIQASIAFIMVSIFDLYFYNVHWFSNPFRSHVAFATLYIIFITVIFVTLVVFHFKWIWVGGGVLIPSIIDIILLNINILNISSKWSLIGFLLFRIAILINISLFNKYLLTEIHN